MRNGELLETLRELQKMTVVVLLAMLLAACGVIGDLPIPGLPGGDDAGDAEAAEDSESSAADVTEEPEDATSSDVPVEPAATAQPTRVPQPSEITAEAMATALLLNNPPAFDAFEWGVSLGLLEANESRTRTDSPRWEVGDTEPFRVGPSAASTPAEVVVVSSDLLIWVDVTDSEELTAETMQPVAIALQESVIEPLREVAGNEWSPGMDGDSRIHIVFVHGLGAGVQAQFGLLDEYPIVLERRSIEREVIYVNLDEVEPGSDISMAAIGQAFWRMALYNNDPNEVTWAAESQVLQTLPLLGYAHPTAMDAFLNDTSTQLNSMVDLDGTITEEQQGAGYLYFLYLLGLLGEDGLADIAQSDRNGIAGVERVTSREGTNANDLFFDWTVATLIDDTSLADGIYGYDRAQLSNSCPMLPVTGLPLTQERSLAPYSFEYHELQGGSQITVDFAGDAASRLVPIEAFDGSNYWWSGNSANSSSSLTRTVDLTNFATATFNYAVWFDIDDSTNDAAYVLFSTDDGLTWTPLEGLQSREIGELVGYQGLSGSGAEATWVQERIDLSALGGQEFLLRFVYNTDKMVTGTGIALDTFSIPEIGFFDGGETLDEGWQAEGWMRSSSVVANSWGVYVVSEGAIDATSGQPTHTVERTEVASNGMASMIVDFPDGTLRAWVVVARAAPGTDEDAVYSIVIDGDSTPIEVAQLPAEGLAAENFSSACSLFKQAAGDSGFNDSVTGGQFVMEVNGPDILHVATIDGNVEDSAINVETILLQPAIGASNGWGAVCRYGDDANFYGFELRADGRHRIFKVIDDTLIELSPLQSSEFIAVGTDAVNTITASCVGDLLGLTINGEVVAAAIDGDLTGGLIGLLATSLNQSQARVAFDNFVLLGPTSESELPAVTPTPVGDEVCDCSANLLSCRDFSGRDEAQACFDFCGGLANDVHLLDGDQNGIVCETVFP